jgi:hypothetical protein
MNDKNRKYHQDIEHQRRKSHQDLLKRNFILIKKLVQTLKDGPKLLSEPNNTTTYSNTAKKDPFQLAREEKNKMSLQKNNRRIISYTQRGYQFFSNP